MSYLTPIQKTILVQAAEILASRDPADPDDLFNPYDFRAGIDGHEIKPGSAAQLRAVWGRVKAAKSGKNCQINDYKEHFEQLVTYLERIEEGKVHGSSCPSSIIPWDDYDI